MPYLIFIAHSQGSQLQNYLQILPDCHVKVLFFVFLIESYHLCLFIDLIWVPIKQFQILANPKCHQMLIWGPIPDRMTPISSDTHFFLQEVIH